MKIIQRHTHSMQLCFSHKGFLLLRATLPLKLNSSKKISDFYKATKTAVAASHGIPEFAVKGSHKKIESKSFDRILLEWQGGCAIDLPDNTDNYDYKIILHYLDGILMSFERPKKVS